MSVAINKTVQYENARTTKIILEITRDGADADIEATAYGPNNAIIEKRSYRIGAVNIRDFVSDPTNLFNRADQWLATQLHETYVPNTDVNL